MNFTFKVIKNDKMIEKCQTHSIRRFMNHLRTINWQKRGLKVYLRVNYGKYEDNFGKKATFYNDGLYKTKEDLWLAFKVFTEK